MKERYFGMAMPRINVEDARAIPVPLGPCKEQREIVKRLARYEDRRRCVLAEVERAIDEMERLNESVLAKAFRGELVEQDPADEPASVLLERIRKAGSKPSGTTAPVRVEHVVHDMILLLESLGGHTDRATLELGLVLMRNDRACQAILDKTRVPRGGATGRTWIVGLDHLLGDLARAKRRITITDESPQIIAVTPNAPKTDGADGNDHRRVRETLKVMAAIKSERLAAVLEKVCDVAYEAVP